MSLVEGNHISSKIISLGILYKTNKLPGFYEAQNNGNRISVHARTQDELSATELALSKIR